MYNKTFQEIFHSFFHSKYSFNDFLKTELHLSTNFFEKKLTDHIFYSYKSENKQFTKESKELYDYHIFLNDILFQNLHTSESVYSYKKNNNIYDTVFLHKESKYYFKTDIKKFFHNINKELVETCLLKNLDRFPKDTKDFISNTLDLIIYNNHLPVGFVTSPAISNVILFEFDEFLQAYSKQNNLIYTRYSDDLIISTKNQESLHNIKTMINDKLIELYGNKFILNEEKTKYLDKTKKVKLLGLIITPDGHITVERNKKENIKQLLYFYKNNKVKFEKFLEDHYDGKLSKAYGSLNYINDIDKSFVSYLRKKYGNFIIDMFLHGTK